MIATDIARVFVALAFLLVTSEQDLWIAYLATILLSTFGAFFEGAKNAATPNLTGKGRIVGRDGVDVLKPILADGGGFGSRRLGGGCFRLQDCVSDKCRFVSRIRLFGVARSGSRQHATPRPPSECQQRKIVNPL